METKLNESNFSEIEKELDKKGTKTIFRIEDSENALCYVYTGVTATIEECNEIILQNLPNWIVSSTLKNGEFKGDAVIMNEN